MRIDHIFPQPGLKALNLELITRGFHCSIILFVPVGGVGVDGPGGVTGNRCYINPLYSYFYLYCYDNTSNIFHEFLTIAIIHFLHQHDVPIRDTLSLSNDVLL